MTKEQYLEMCEMLGTEPVDAEIPVDFTDFPELVQQILNIYNVLISLGRYEWSIFW